MASHEKQELSPQTKKILIYIDKHSPDSENLKRKFGNSPVYVSRLFELQRCSPMLIRPNLRGDRKNAYFTSTEAGKKYVEDFNDKKRTNRKEFLQHSVLVPIAVTLLTLIAVNFLRLILPTWLARLLQQ